MALNNEAAWDGPVCCLQVFLVARCGQPPLALPHKPNTWYLVRNYYTTLRTLTLWAPFLGGYGVYPSSAVFHGAKKISSPLEDHIPDEHAVLRVLNNHLL